jgi:hypothetical protein
LLSEISKRQAPSTSNSTSSSGSSTREDRIHGYLLIILEIVKFAGLEFEQILEKYLSKYNLYHQQSPQTSPNNNLFYNADNSQRSNTLLTTPTINDFNTNSSLIENTARSCEEMHAANLLRLLPHSCFDPLHANDPFMFLFKTSKISVNAESRTCAQMITDDFDSIMQACLNTIDCLNLSSVTNANYRCIQETILALLPRLARFDQKKFNPNTRKLSYMKETLSFLTNLNNNTSFLSTNSSVSSASSSSANSSPAQTNSNSSTNTSTNTGFVAHLHIVFL